MARSPTSAAMLLDPSGSTVPEMLVPQPTDGGHLRGEAGGANGATTGCSNATMERTRATSKKRDGHTKVYYQGFSYVRANITSVKISYRCSSYRQKCKARFVYVAATISFDFSELVPHTCRSGSALQSRTAQADGSPCEDVSEAVLEEVDQLAVETNMTQRGIWLYVMDKFYMQSGPPVRGVSKNAVENRVKYARGKKTGGNRNRAVELPPMSKVRGSMQGFFQFQYSWHDDIKAQKDSVGVDRVLAWAHPELRNLLRFENLSWFLDGTFRCAPAGYKQCVTIMVHESSTDLYIPAIFTVATSMQKEHYVKLLRCIEDCVGRKLTPKEVVCDFEAALIGAIRACFPDVRIIGCLFHFKQACRRKLKEYQIPREEAKLAMAPNVFDILTVIDPSKIEVKVIAWVKAKIKKVCEAKQVTYSRRKWRKFWDYFRRTWLEMFPPTYWNVFGMRRDIVSRTNNPLERFHRHLNGKIKAPHPAISSFVDMLEGISREYVAQRLAIQFGLARPPRRKRFQLPRAPQLPEVADIVDSEESEDEGEQPTVATDDPASCSSAPGSEDDAAEMDHETADYSPDNSFGYGGDASAIV